MRLFIARTGVMMALLVVTAAMLARRAKGVPATAPAATTAPAASTAPASAAVFAPAPGAATQPEEDIRLNFRDMPLNTVLEHLSQVAGFVVVKEAPVDGRVTVLSMGPVTPAEAVALLDTVLKAGGFTAVREGRTLRILARDKAKKGNVPVHVGTDPAGVDAGNELITQVIPVRNVDAVKLRDDLKPLLSTDADITANGGANALVITDASANIKRVVQIVATLDRREGVAAEMRIIPLKNASAAAAVKMVQSIFPEHKAAPAPQGQPQPPPQPRDEKALGGGVDQGLRGAKVTAAADERTNSVVIAGPAETIKLVENMLKELDANPATVLTVRSFRLKISDAASVAKLVTSMFADAGQPGQVRLYNDQPLQARVTAAAEEKTNTLVITAPASVLKVVEDVVKDLESAGPNDGSVRTYKLKYADAWSAARVLRSVFSEGQSSDPPKTGAPGPLGRMSATADRRTNTIFVTGSAEALRSVDKMVEELDAIPTSGSTVRFFHLKQADAVAASKMIAKFFKPPEGSSDDSSPSSSPKRGERQQFGVTADADDRSNTVVVSAPPEAMAVVESIIKEIETDPLAALEMRSFTLHYADAAATAALLTTVFQPDAAQGAANPAGKAQAARAKVVAAPDGRTNTVVVTAQADAMALVEGVVRLLDAGPVAGPDMKLFQLRYADATEAARLVQSVFAPPPPADASGGKGGSGKQPSPDQRRGAVSANVDERTNTLVLSGSPEALAAAEALVRHIDSNPTSEEVVFMYRLRNGQAVNVALVLNELFGNIPQGASALAANAGGFLGSALGQFGRFGAGGGPLGADTGARRSLSRTTPGGAAGGTGIGARRGTLSFGGAGNGANTAALSAAAGRALTEVMEQVFVVAHPDTNSLLVSTAARYEKQIRQIIDELDRAVPQVLIKVLVAEVSHDDSADLGVDFSVLNRRANGHGVSAGTSFGQPPDSKGLVVSYVEENVNVTLHALATVGKLDVLSRPYILASDNQTASITVGQEVPFITNTRITELGQTLNTIQYQDVGIILNVTPHINPEGLVILDVAPEISQLTGSTVPISQGVDAPVIAKRSAESRVGVKDGQTVVIGGLMEDRKISTVLKVPVLGDLPLVGAVFRRTQTSKAKTELLIFLTPHVAQEPGALDPMSAAEMRGTRLTPGAVGPGVFDEHVRGLRRGSAPQTQPATQPAPPTIEFETDVPSTGPAPATAPTSIRMPGQ